MDAFDAAEEVGRTKVIRLFGEKHNLVLSENKYDCWDMSGCTTGAIDEESKNFFIEVKDRKFKSDEYDTAFMEYLKLSHLRRLAIEYNGDMFYVCTYSDNVAYVFNLSKIAITDIYIKVERVNKCTVEDSFIEDKIFIELPLSAGKKYKIK